MPGKSDYSETAVLNGFLRNTGIFAQSGSVYVGLKTADPTDDNSGGTALAHQRLHWRRSVDGQWLMAQADTDDAEHAAMLDRAWVTAGGTANQARAYLNANAAAWGDSSDV
jgi:hypothetical protein